MPKKIRVGVLMGGSSAEREISLITGQAVFDNLNRKKYIPTRIIMTRENIFNLVLNNGSKRRLDIINKDRKLFDIIFIALHGTPGEDGTVQGLFDMLKIPYTGPEALASAICMNKVYAAQIYIVNGLPTPKFIHFKKTGWKEQKQKVLDDVKNKIGYPMVLKPVDQGSAVGVTMVKNKQELIKAVNKTIKIFPWLMAQTFIFGQEATCGILEKDGQIMALPPTHIIANAGEFYDYKSKYGKGGSTHICPADFPAKINKGIERLAILAHQALGCRGMSRTDIFYADNGKLGENLYIIETNTIPGMTPTSLLPEAARVQGIGFSEMLELIIEASL